MHPVALAGGIAALDIALTGQALYALHVNDREKEREEASRRRRVVSAAAIYRPAAPRQRPGRGDQPLSRASTDSTR
jgi:hypothetical protein